MADEDKKEEIIEAEIVEPTVETEEATAEPKGETEVAVEEQAQQPVSPDVEEPPASPDPVPETTVNIVIPPIAEETGDIEGIAVAKEELAQIHGEEKPKEEIVPSEPTPASDEAISEKVINGADGKPYTIRSEETGDKVYVVVNEKRYWIKNPETLAKLGFHLGGETRITFNELLKLPEGKPVDLTVPDAKNPWDEPEEEQPSGESTNVWN